MFFLFLISLSTSNILINDYGEIVLSDFGLAKTISEIEKGLISVTKRGTQKYRAPETYYILKDPSLYLKSDIYSFGLIIAEIITGYIWDLKDIPYKNLSRLVAKMTYIDPLGRPSIEQVYKTIFQVYKLVRQRLYPETQDLIPYIVDIIRELKSLSAKEKEYIIRKYLRQ